MLEIVFPCIQNIGVGQRPVDRHWAAGHHGSKRGESDLTIERRINTAARSKARQLRVHYALFFRARSHVTVRRWVVGNRGINIKTVDRRLGVGLPSLMRQLAVSGDDGRLQINGAGVLASGAAEPGIVFAVVVLGGRWRDGGLWLLL